MSEDLQPLGVSHGMSWPTGGPNPSFPYKSLGKSTPERTGARNVHDMYLGITDLFPSTNPIHGHNKDVLGNWPKRVGDRPRIRNVSFLA
jgi:hypothetical protein